MRSILVAAAGAALCAIACASDAASDGEDGGGGGGGNSTTGGSPSGGTGGATGGAGAAGSGMSGGAGLASGGTGLGGGGTGSGGTLGGMAGSIDMGGSGGVFPWGCEQTEVACVCDNLAAGHTLTDCGSAWSCCFTWPQGEFNALCQCSNLSESNCNNFISAAASQYPGIERATSCPP